MRPGSRADVLLHHVDWLVREGIAIFEMREQLDFFRQRVTAPEQKTIRDLTRKAGNQFLAHNGKWKVPQISCAIVNIAARLLPDIGEEKLAAFRCTTSRGEFQLARSRRA